MRIQIEKHCRTTYIFLATSKYLKVFPKMSANCTRIFSSKRTGQDVRLLTMNLSPPASGISMALMCSSATSLTSTMLLFISKGNLSGASVHNIFQSIPILEVSPDGTTGSSVARGYPETRKCRADKTCYDEKDLHHELVTERSLRAPNGSATCAVRRTPRPLSISY